MHIDEGSGRSEAEQIRDACVLLGIDEEMTALILGSHRRDRPLDASRSIGDEGIRSYVRRKLMTWEDIFEGPIRSDRPPEEPEPDRTPAPITRDSRGRRASAR